MAYSMTKSTAWLDNSNNANKLRQSYLKGFLDISGGPVYLRADNSFNFYTAENPTAPAFALGPKVMTVIDAGDSRYTRDISTNKLSFIHDLSENVTAAFAEIRSRFAGSGSTTTTDFTATGDSTVNGNSKVEGDSEIGGQLLVSGNTTLRQNLSVDGNVTISSQLDVAGNTRFMGKSNYFAGDVEINGNETINAQLFVEGDAYLKGRVYVTKDALFYADVRTIGKVDAASGLFTMEDVSANRNLRIGGISTLGDKVTITKNGLDVTGPSTLTGAFSVTGASTLAGALNVTGVSTLTGDVNVTGSSALTGTLGVSALATLNSLEVTNNATIKKELFVEGNTSIKKLTVVGASSLTGTLGVTGASSLTGTLGVSALATLNSLEVTNDSTMKKNLFVEGNTSIKKLTVVGASSLTGALAVNGASSLTGTLGVSDLASLHSLNVANNATIEKEFFVNGNTSIKKLTVTGPADVTGKATLNSLEVTLASDLKSTLAVAGATTMNADLLVNTNAKVIGNFDVSGDAHVQDILVDGNIDMSTTKRFTTGSLFLSDSNFNTPNCVGTTEGNLTLAPNLPTDWVHIKSNLIVDGSINFTGSMIYTDVQVNVSEELDISANGPNYVLRATQNGGIAQDIAIFKNSAAVDPVFLVGGNQTVCINKAVADSNFAFDVSGASKFSSTLDVTGGATFRNDMSVTGSYSSVNGHISLTNGNIMAPQGTVSASKLALSSSADISGDVTIYGNLILKGASTQDFIDQSFSW
jgi:hypothetical protein